MKLVTQRQFDAALVAVLGKDFAANIPNRVQRQNTAIHMIFMDEMEAGPLVSEVAVIRAGAKTLQEHGCYKWADEPAAEQVA